MPLDTTKLIRDPEDWARDWGWVSRRRALNIAAKIEAVAVAIEGALDGDEGADVWAKELRSIKKKLAPEMVPAQRKHEKMRKEEERVAAMREP